MHREVPKGSWSWSLYVAELIAWGAVVVLGLVLVGAGLAPRRLLAGLGLLVIAALGLVALFRLLIPRFGSTRWLLPAGTTGGLAFGCGFYLLVHSDVTVAQLGFVPVVAVVGVLSGIRAGVTAGIFASGAYVATATLLTDVPDPAPILLSGGVNVLSGAVSGALATEMRSHYAGEREEHRLATAVRHRLLAVLDAVDEAIVFRDRQGTARVVNRRAGEVFGIKPDDFLGGPVVELLRAVARATEDPEGFMETFQEVRDDPEAELRVWVEQIIPERRQLRLYSAPTLDDAGELVGRIDVYTDVTEGMRRAAEVERLYDEARQTAEAYQRSLLPQTLPKLPRLGVVAHYVPAAGRRAVCGDFYDFVPLPDGNIGLVLGDVCGIGPEAANDAALTRYTLRSFAAQSGDIAEVMERLNAHLVSNLRGERFVRVFLAGLDPERARLEYVSAGHVPPVVYRAKTGGVEWLQEGDMVLGVTPDLTFKAGEIELHPGDTLVLYTDGVTEAPRNGRPFGQGKFSDLITDFGAGTPGEVVQAIRRSVETWSFGSELRDDLALVVCQVVPDTAVDEPTRELVLPNEPARIADVRRFVSSFLSDLRCPVDVSHEVVLAANEAAANACRYGRRPNSRGELRVRCAARAREVVLTIADEGPGFDARSLARRSLPDRFASGGRGLYLMQSLMDDVDIASSSAGTTVTLVRSIPPAPAL